MNKQPDLSSIIARFGFMKLIMMFCLGVSAYAMDPTNRMDFDGDGKADIAVYREGCQRVEVTNPPTPCTSYLPSYFWYIKSTNGVVTPIPYGQSMDFCVPADYTGEGTTDFAVYRWFEPVGSLNDSNSWYISGAPNNFFGNVYGRKAPRNFGPIPGPSPTPLTAEVAELRRDLFSTNPMSYSYTFYWQSAESFSATSTGLDTANHRVHQFAVPQDYLNNDKVSEVAVFEIKINRDTPSLRTSCYRVWVNPSTPRPDVCLDNDVTVAVPGDYDGNGLADYAGIAYSGGNMIWKIKLNFGPDNPTQTLPAVTIPATAEARPVAADYDGDHITDIAFVVPVTANNVTNWYWEIRPSKGGAFIHTTFGYKTDTLLAQPYFSDPWY